MINKSALLLFLFVGFLAAQNKDFITITYSEKTSLRDLAKNYFNNANDWQFIVYYNGYKNSGEIRNNVGLILPLSFYKQYKDNITLCKNILDSASSNGASIFSKSEFNSVISLYNQIFELESKGDLNVAYLKIKETQIAASKLNEIVKFKRKQKITAMITSKIGEMESQKLYSQNWQEAKLNQELFEKEKIRTLAETSAEIKFYDGSRLKLSSNSMAVIETLEKDLILNSSNTDITIVRGKVNSYLNFKNPENKIQLKIEGVNTKFKSNNFWASKEKKKTQLANYDSGEIDVISGGVKIILKQNEASQVLEGQVPEKPRKLLSTPSIDQIFYNKKTKDYSISYLPISFAYFYNIEISEDAYFSNIIYKSQQRGLVFNWRPKNVGIYFIRLSALDSDLFPSPYSLTKQITMLEDDYPPYLKIEEPSEKKVYYSREIQIKGELEKGAILKVNNILIKSNNLQFDTIIRFNDGLNELNFLATDNNLNQTIIKKNINIESASDLIKKDTLYTNKSYYVIDALLGSTVNNLNQGKNEFIFSSVKNLISELTIYYNPSKLESKITYLPNYTTDSSIKLELNFNRYVTMISTWKSLKLQNKFNLSLTDFKQNKILAKDKFSNFFISEKEILFDSLPPILLNSKISKTSQGIYLDYNLIIESIDSGVGLANFAEVELEINNTNNLYTLRKFKDKFYNLEIIINKNDRVKFRSIYLYDLLMNMVKVEL